MEGAEYNMTSCTYDTLTSLKTQKFALLTKWGPSSLVPQTHITLSLSLHNITHCSL